VYVEDVSTLENCIIGRKQLGSTVVANESNYTDVAWG